MKEEKNKRTLDLSELKTIDGFLINENPEYFIANLKNVVNQPISIEEDIDEDDKPIDMDEEDEQEEYSNSLSFKAFKERSEKNEVLLF